MMTIYLLLLSNPKSQGALLAIKALKSTQERKQNTHLQCNLNLSLEKKHGGDNPHRQNHAVSILFINSLLSRKMGHLLKILQSSSLTTSVVIHTDFPV